MTTGNWLNNDGLQLFFGTSKAIARTGGEYKSYGSNRVVEVDVDLSTLNTSTSTILDFTQIFPSLAGIQVEKVELVAQVAMSTASSPTLSVGVIGLDQTTVPSNGATAFVSALAASNLSTIGNVVTLVVGSSGAGNYVGAYQSTGWSTPQYLTAKLGTATATGNIRVRIFYHGVGTITQ